MLPQLIKQHLHKHGIDTRIVEQPHIIIIEQTNSRNWNCINIIPEEHQTILKHYNLRNQVPTPYNDNIGVPIAHRQFINHSDPNYLEIITKWAITHLSQSSKTP